MKTPIIVFTTVLIYSAFCFAQNEKQRALYELGSGEIVYVEPGLTGYEDDVNVYKGKRGHLEKLEINIVNLYLDGGTLVIDLKNGDKMVSPPTHVKVNFVPSYYDHAQQNQIEIRRLEMTEEVVQEVLGTGKSNSMSCPKVFGQ